jgi:hypothetical protein
MDGRVEEQRNELPKIAPRLMSVAKRVLNTNSVLLASHIKTEHMTGGTSDTRLAVRSGRLRASCVAIRAVEKEGSVEAGVAIGTVYARTHIGPPGQITTIIPKRGKYLAIPLGAAKSAAGVSKGSVREGPWGATFVRKTKKGALIIFGRQEITKGYRMGMLRSKIVPLFLLLKSVSIPARIDPQEQIDWIMPKIKDDFKAKGITAQ